MKLMPKLSVCAKAIVLTYEQILIKEGVYMPVGFPNTRLIVLHGVGTAPSPLVLWKHGESSIEPADKGWSTCSFEFMSDTIVLETK